MKVTAVSIKNILGLEEYRLTPGSITRLKGQNSAGKSSVIGAIMAALQGGSLASVQSVNKETGEPIGEAEIKLVIDDGAYRIEREGAKTTVFERVGESRAEKKMPRGPGFVDGIFDRVLSNPLRLIHGTPKERLDWLLEVLPMTLTPEEVKAAVGDDLWELVQEEATEGHPLQVLTAVRKKIFETRTGVNVSKDDKEATYKQIEARIPAKMPEATSDSVTALIKQRDEVSVRVARAKDAADAALKEKNTAARAAYDATVEAARSDGNASISAREKERDAAIAKLKEEFDRAVARLKEATQEGVDVIKAHVVMRQDVAQQTLAAAQADAENERQAAVAAIVTDEQLLSTLTGDLERARAEVDSASVLRTQIDMVEKFRAEVESLKGKSERYTAGLDAVDALKSRLLAALPVAGLEIDGKSILVNKIPFDTLNTAQQITVAVKVAALRAKQRLLAILCIDGAEALDAKNLAALEKAILEEGCQAFIAIRTEGPLTVETV